MWKCKNAHQKDTCFKEIRLRAQYLVTILDWIVFWGRSPMWLLNPIKEYLLTQWIRYSNELQNTKQMAIYIIWNLQPSHIHCVSHNHEEWMRRLTCPFDTHYIKLSLWNLIYMSIFEINQMYLLYICLQWWVVYLKSWTWIDCVSN